LGYKPDSRPFEVLSDKINNLAAYRAILRNTMHNTSKEAIKAAIDYLHSGLKTCQSEQQLVPPSLVWVDVPGEVSDEGTFRELDVSLEELFQAGNTDTVMLVLGQGNLELLRVLLAKKQRYQWDLTQRQNNLKIADTPIMDWDEGDDQDLAVAAASVASGVAFLRSK